MKTIGKIKKPEAPVFDAEGYQVNLTTLNGTALPDLKRVVAQPLRHGGRGMGRVAKPPGASLFCCGWPRPRCGPCARRPAVRVKRFLM